MTENLTTSIRRDPRAFPAWPRQLLDLLATARQEIIAHGNEHGLCPVCGSAFPCPRAELAAFALDAL